MERCICCLPRRSLCVLPRPRPPPLPSPLSRPLSSPLLPPLLPLTSAAAASAAVPRCRTCCCRTCCYRCRCTPVGRCCARLSVLFAPAQDLHRRDQRGAGQLHHPITGRGLHPSGQPGELPTLVRDRHVRRRHGHGLPAGGRCPVDTMKRATYKALFWVVLVLGLGFVFFVEASITWRGGEGRGGRAVRANNVVVGYERRARQQLRCAGANPKG